MTEAPQFEGPLRNPDVSEDADREMDKTMERLPAIAARRIVPEFAALENSPAKPPAARDQKKYITAAEQRLPHAQEILSQVRNDLQARTERETLETKGTDPEEMIRLLRDTDPQDTAPTTGPGDKAA
jgi:hypothetical protein